MNSKKQVGLQLASAGFLAVVICFSWFYFTTPTSVRPRFRLDQIQKDVDVIGQLGVPIDQIVHVQCKVGKVVEPYWPDGRVWVNVEKVNGSALQNGNLIELVIMNKNMKSSYAVGDVIETDAVEIPFIKGNSKAEMQLVENFQRGTTWDPPSWPSVRTSIDSKLFTVGL